MCCFVLVDAPSIQLCSHNSITMEKGHPRTIFASTTAVLSGVKCAFVCRIFIEVEEQ